MKISYQKPHMSFVDLRSRQEIAANDKNCMPIAAGNNLDFYYDIVGNGWIHIIAAGDDCSGKTQAMYWEPNEENPDAERPDQSVIDMSMLQGTGYEKQQFSGAYRNPQDDWS